MIGLVLLLGFLLLKKEVIANLGFVSDVFTQHLGLLFLTAAVGAVLYLPSLKPNGVAIVLALLCSLVATFTVSVMMMKLLTKNDCGNEGVMKTERLAHYRDLGLPVG